MLTSFLSASQLPPHPTSYRHRTFRTDLDTGAVQLTVVTGTTAQASALAKHYDDLIRTCAARIEAASPDVEAEGRDYGKLSVEEGAHVRGVHTETSSGSSDIALLSVGRDGRTVTVVRWGQMGDFADAPVTAFKKTTRTAVDRLY